MSGPEDKPMLKSFDIKWRNSFKIRRFVKKIEMLCNLYCIVCIFISHQIIRSLTFHNIV